MSNTKKLERRGLTAITIENFKGIREPVTIPLRPITLLFGANSAGKSTIIQALQYAWEVLENRNPDVDRTRIGGESIDLGGFRNLVHGHDLDREIKITLHFVGKPLTDPFLPPWQLDIYKDSEPQPASWEIDIGRELELESMAVSFSAAWDRSRNRAYVRDYTVYLNGQPFGAIYRDEAGAVRLDINRLHSLFCESVGNEYIDVLEDLGEKFSMIKDDWRRWGRAHCMEVESLARAALAAEGLGPIGAYPEKMFLQWEGPLSRNYVLSAEAMKFDEAHFPAPKVTTRGGVIPDRWDMALNPLDWGAIVEKKPNYGLNEDGVSVLSQLMVGSGAAILEKLRDLRYLGPLRVVPNRLHESPLHSKAERWADGMAAWDLLYRDEADDNGNFPLVEQCSVYMRDVLGMGYSLRREDCIQLPDHGDILTNLRMIAARYEDMEGTDLRDQVLFPLEALPREPKLRLYDERNQIDVSPMDIGVGVSQTLPVVVGAVDPDCSIFAVEQPELHIHPAIQCRLADVFIVEGIEKGRRERTFLLETHSEHIILRLLRRIRETATNALDNPDLALTPNDVSVVYVEQKDDGVELTVLPIDEDGDFTRPWPKGFFEERAEELF